MCINTLVDGTFSLQCMTDAVIKNKTFLQQISNIKIQAGTLSYNIMLCCKSIEISLLFLQNITVSFIKGHSHAEQQHTIHFNCINSAHTHTHTHTH